MSADPSQEILFEVKGQIATITFNRPEAMNALTWNMYDRLVSYCEELDRRDRGKTVAAVLSTARCR